MTAPPIKPVYKAFNGKASVAGLERLSRIAVQTGFLKQDIISACLQFMPEDKLIEILVEQKRVVENQGKDVDGIVRRFDKLSDDQKRILLDRLTISEPPL